MKVLLAFFTGLFLGPLVYPIVMALPWWTALVGMGVGLVLLCFGPVFRRMVESVRDWYGV